MKAIRRLLSLLAVLVGLSAGAVGGAEPGAPVVVGHVSGVINPVAARYVDRLLDDAESRSVAAVILVIDTPGGLLSSTYEITGRLLNAQVPVVTYVAPAGARAASAGTFITLAGHVAAMAPTTNIGAARPVAASGEDIQGDLRTKAENDATAAITSIALARGRNVEWAEAAVRQSASIRDDEALRLGVVDLLAPDLPALVAALDGRTVELPSGPVTLQTASAPLETDDQNLFERILHFVVDPQVAALLFALGSYGLIIELANPGLLFPGVVGAISIVLALFAFGSLDANATGVVLMLIAIGLFVAETQIASHGLLTLGGLVTLLLGMAILFPPLRPTLPGFRYTLDPVLIGVVVLSTAAFFALIARASFRYLRLPVVSGSSMLVGATGSAKSDLAPTGIVHVAGEDWTAESSGVSIVAGSPIRVQRIDGIRLIVEPAPHTGEEHS